MSACRGGYLLIQNTICVWGVTLGVHVHCLCAHPCRTQNLLMFIVYAREIANCVRTKPFTSQYSPCITHTPINPFLSLFTPFPLFYLCLFFHFLNSLCHRSYLYLISFRISGTSCMSQSIVSLTLFTVAASYRFNGRVIVEAVYRTICFKK